MLAGRYVDMFKCLFIIKSFSLSMFFADFI